MKPDGTIFANTNDDWEFPQSKAVKAGRWLGYVPFTGIKDERNAPPEIHAFSLSFVPKLKVEQRSLYIPDFYYSLAPTVTREGIDAPMDSRRRQPYHLVIFGEKSSIGDVVLPIAHRFQADMYLPNGEISDTLIHRMVDDNGGKRPLIVFCISDCDPSGWQMPVSIGRKLQAFRDLLCPDLEFEVRPIALTVEQVRDLGVPSTPLKETERRKDKWMEAFGVEQTEIDALAQLRPEILAKIVRDEISPFFDDTLDERVMDAQQEWMEDAQEALDQLVDHDQIEGIRRSAHQIIGEVRGRLDGLNDKLAEAVDLSELEWPTLDLPEPEINTAVHGKPLVSSSWSWPDATRALIDHKNTASGRPGAPPGGRAGSNQHPAPPGT